MYIIFPGGAGLFLGLLLLALLLSLSLWLSQLFTIDIDYKYYFIIVIIISIIIIIIIIISSSSSSIVFGCSIISREGPEARRGGVAGARDRGSGGRGGDPAGDGRGRQQGPEPRPVFKSSIRRNGPSPWEM